MNFKSKMGEGPLTKVPAIIIEEGDENVNQSANFSLSQD
jgi:hypothetical protein